VPPHHHHQPPQPPAFLAEVAAFQPLPPSLAPCMSTRIRCSSCDGLRGRIGHRVWLPLQSQITSRAAASHHDESGHQQNGRGHHRRGHLSELGRTKVTVGMRRGKAWTKWKPLPPDTGRGCADRATALHRASRLPSPTAPLRLPGRNSTPRRCSKRRLAWSKQRWPSGLPLSGKGAAPRKASCLRWQAQRINS